MITLIVFSIIFMMVGLIRFSYLLTLDRVDKLSAIDSWLVVLATLSAFIFSATLGYLSYMA